jgi:hypothetical protein
MWNKIVQYKSMESYKERVLLNYGLSIIKNQYEHGQRNCRDEIHRNVPGYTSDN